MKRNNFYLLGRAVSLFDPEGDRLTPGGLTNLLAAPAQAPIVLRHCWPEMLANEAVRATLDLIDWPAGFGVGEPPRAQFWLGYYRTRTREVERVEG